MTLIGNVLAGRYEILEEIGSGGMAVVYKARCQLLNRYVAVKVLRPDLQNDAEFVRRFNVEAQAAASLTHPNIVSIFDVGVENGLHYIVMEYVEGETLKKYIEKKGVLPWREAVDYVIQIARGLDQAHKNSIVHRDIKPHNIIMTSDGVMKVTDFGIARANMQSTVTCEDTAIGSVHYISPEQARGGYTDERSDIYSLGVVLYEMLTGKLPFDNERPVTVAIMHLQSEPVLPREYNISIPLTLENVVMKAMAKDVASRYKNTSEMIADLTAVLNDPERTVVSEQTEEQPDADSTLIMPAVKLDGADGKTEELSGKEAGEEKIREEKNNMAERKNRISQNEIDKKKEKKVISFAIASAAAIIIVIVLAFMWVSGFFGTDSSKIVIPSLEGMLYEEAVEKYVKNADESLGYGFNIIKGDNVVSDKEKGTIVSQSPKAGSKQEKKDIIMITVEISEGKEDIRLENYTKYRDEREVEIALKKLGLRVDFVEEYSEDIPKGSIIRQDPSSGSYVRPGDEVVLYISKGPEKTEEEEKEKETEKTDDTKKEEEKQEPDKTESEKTPDEKTNEGEKVQKKSSTLTLYGPKDKESAVVQVNVNGRTVYSKKLLKGESDVVRLEGTTNSVDVEILHDGVSQQKGTVRLH
ncbi:MAG: Stk1 family PASTA domain-containing Ser/Thr kinase [Ruminococcaceae bacterium]|nr:Stk1 family PASTA domain-containing Ser/Thr kinase [Oscillospiraceae bacterium]